MIDVDTFQSTGLRLRGQNGACAVNGVETGYRTGLGSASVPSTAAGNARKIYGSSKRASSNTVPVSRGLQSSIRPCRRVSVRSSGALRVPDDDVRDTPCVSV